jgi:hypothetical protein
MTFSIWANDPPIYTDTDWSVEYYTVENLDKAVVFPQSDLNGKMGVELLIPGMAISCAPHRVHDNISIHAFPTGEDISHLVQVKVWETVDPYGYKIRIVPKSYPDTGYEGMVVQFGRY